MDIANHLRANLVERFQPPIDVLLDPSLLVSSSSLTRLSNSNVFESQTQATLGSRPTKPRVGNLFVPSTFRRLIESEEQLDVQKTSAWNFYRRQAEGAFRDEIIELLDQNDVSVFTNQDTPSGLHWENAFDDPDRRERLKEILEEELAFLRSGGVVLSRTPNFVETFRDVGVPLVDAGQAELQSDLEETLVDIGYRHPAGLCAFGVPNAGDVVDALVGNVLETRSDLLLYQIGK
jgi:hypothetical protein